MYKTTKYPAACGCGLKTRTSLFGFSTIQLFSSCPDCFCFFNKVLGIFQKNKDSLVLQHAAAADATASASARVVSGGLDDFVGQVVTEWLGNRQGLHLLGGHHPAKGHSAYVLQTGNATRTLPEVHTTITSP